MFRQMNASTGCDKRVEAFFDLWGSGIRAAAATAAGKKEEVPYRPGSLNLYNMNNEKNMEGNQMAAITAGMVKELREMTGAGMMDCKKALAATDGDMEKAVEFLREKGLAAASKKAGRIAAEGLVKTLVSEDGDVYKRQACITSSISVRPGLEKLWWRDEFQPSCRPCPTRRM